MKCWIDNSLCPYQTGNDKYGFLSMPSNFCRDCNFFKSNLDDIKMILEEIEIPTSLDEEEYNVDFYFCEEVLDNLDSPRIILASLKMLEKSIRKQNKGKEISPKQDYLLSQIISIKEIFLSRVYLSKNF
jgi:hypothetical protein